MSSSMLKLLILTALVATSCMAQAPGGAPTVSPTPTPTPSPSPSVAPLTPSPSPSPTPVPAPAPTPETPSPSPTPTPSAESPFAPAGGPAGEGPTGDDSPSGSFTDGWVHRVVIAGTAVTATCLSMALM